MTWEEQCALLQAAIDAHHEYVAESNRAIGASQAHAMRSDALNDDEN